MIQGDKLMKTIVPKDKEKPFSSKTYLLVNNELLLLKDLVVGLFKEFSVEKELYSIVIVYASLDEKIFPDDGNERVYDKFEFFVTSDEQSRNKEFLRICKELK
jgi:hypothetical protein